MTIRRQYRPLPQSKGWEKFLVVDAKNGQAGGSSLLLFIVFVWFMVNHSIHLATIVIVTINSYSDFCVFLIIALTLTRIFFLLLVLLLFLIVIFLLFSFLVLFLSLLLISPCFFFNWFWYSFWCLPVSCWSCAGSVLRHQGLRTELIQGCWQGLVGFRGCFGVLRFVFGGWVYRFSGLAVAGKGFAM